MTVTSAKSDRNLPLSLPHRLLVILLRRGYLKDHANLESLLAGTEHQIRIKHQNSLYIGTKPLTTSAITAYMKRRTTWLGYPLDCTFYCWRRRAATLVQRAAGTDRARQFLNHKPGTFTYEDYYEEGLDDFDIFDVMFDGGDGSDNTRILQNVGTVALHRTNLVKKCLDRERVIKSYVDHHPDVIKAVNTGVRKDILSNRARIRRHALAALLMEEKELQKQNMTQDELRERLVALKKKPQIVKMINQRLQRVEMLDFSLEDATDKAADLIDLVDCFGMGELDDKDEEDNEDEDNEDEGEEMSEEEDNKGEDKEDIAVNIDRDEDQDEETNILRTDPRWPRMVKIFMEMLLEFENEATNGAGKWEAMGVGNLRGVTTCSLCAADPYVPGDRKKHDYGRTAKLKEHLLTNYHSGKETFSRRMNVLAQESDNSRFTCPYGCERSYGQLSHLMKHIRDASGNAKYQGDHEDRKGEDGWYEPDWNPPPVPEGQAVATARLRKKKADRQENEDEDERAAVIARSNAELAAALPYSYHRIEDEEKDVIYQGQRNLIYYGGDEPIYNESSLVYHGEEDETGGTAPGVVSYGEPTMDLM
ncbi:hypothetical protein V8E51_003081 [Hyaloscypha variabilis]